MISSMLSQSFGASVEAADTATGAMKSLGTKRYDLVLVNRIFDLDGDAGLDFIRTARAAHPDVPFMLVSNYDDAQAAAVDVGAVRGFGKSALHDAETQSLLAHYLSAERRSAAP
jgi:CheY-like chemotaxis protein